MNTGVLNDFAQVADPLIVSRQAEIFLADGANSLNLTNSNQHQYILLFLPLSQITQMTSFQTQIHWMWQAVASPFRFKRDRKMLRLTEISPEKCQNREAMALLKRNC